MMKRTTLTALLTIWFCAGTVLPFPAWAETPSLSPNNSTVDHAAISVVETYLQALVDGDIAGLKLTLSATLLEEKQPILDSAGYDVTLRQLYAGALYNVLAAQWLAADKARVDAEVVDSSGNTLETSFLVIRTADGTFLIDSELQ